MAGQSKRKTPKGDRKLPGDGGGDGDGCDIAIDLDLQGVRPEGLQGLKEGDELKLRIETAKGYESIVCVRADGVIVGALANFLQHTSLLRCLHRDVPYAVWVKDLGSGGCHVVGGRADR